MASPKKIPIKIAALVLIAALFCLACFLGVRLAFQRPHLSVVQEQGGDPNLVFAVMKAESGFREDAVSDAGAVGLMQLMPATAEFVCERSGLPFRAERLKEGAYNVELGCRYLDYLLKKFPEERTALAAYNAGEGVVSEWLKREEYSPDGARLTSIPYPETERYVKKVIKFRKIYRILYH